MESIHNGHREHMRRRFLQTGLEGFADHEALELLLYYAIPRRDTNPIAHELLRRYGSLNGVLTAPVEDLQQVEGIGEKAALLFSLVAQLSQKARMQEAARQNVIDSAEAAGRYLLECFAGETRETVLLLCLDRKARLLSCRRLAEGTAFSAGLDTRRVVETALLSGADGVILAHNHPSGIALPSEEDFTATGQIRAALATVGIELVDHIVAADGDFVSMAQSGWLQGQDCN